MRYSKDKVSIIIPAKNEGAGLKKIISQVKPYASEIIVVDGHSTDDTKKIVLSQNVKYILDHGRGRGDGVRMGVKKAKGEIVVLFDADGSHPPKDIPNLVLPIFKKQADMVMGSRRTGGSFDLSITLDGMARSVGSDFLVYLVNKKFGSNLSDILFSFRAIRKSTFKKLDLQSDGFSLEQEMVIKCLEKEYKITEIPVRENKRAWGISKLKTKTGIQFFLFLIRDLYFKSL